MKYVPERITLGSRQHLTTEVMVAIGDLARESDRDPREVAGALIVERLAELGRLEDQAASESDE